MVNHVNFWRTHMETVMSRFFLLCGFSFQFQSVVHYSQLIQLCGQLTLATIIGVLCR